MGLSRMQGTSGYIGYYNEDHGKLTRRSCRHYHTDAQWCMKLGRVCKCPSRCVHHSEQTHTYVKQVKSKKQSCKECCFYSREGRCLAHINRSLIWGGNCPQFLEKQQKKVGNKKQATKGKAKVKHKPEVKSKSKNKSQPEVKSKQKVITQHTMNVQEVKRYMVSTGNHVKLLNLTTQSVLEIKLVAGHKVKKSENKVFIHSPLGHALVNQRLGSVIEVKGETHKILEIIERKKEGFVNKVTVRK